jgi:6-phosphofructokinase 1
VGGFEAFYTVLQLAEERENFPEFKIPMVVLPATIRSGL